MAAMNVHGQTDPEDAGDAVGNGIGARLHYLLNKYGAEQAKTIIIEVRHSILGGGQCPKVEIEDTVLEGMYRAYVAASISPVLTFIEYKALVEVIITLSAD